MHSPSRRGGRGAVNTAINQSGSSLVLAVAGDKIRKPPGANLNAPLKKKLNAETLKSCHHDNHNCVTPRRRKGVAQAHSAD